MSNTYRKKDYTPPWVRRSKYVEEWRYHSDCFNHDGDKNPPKWFKTNEIRKHRHKSNQKTRMTDDPVIDTEFKMPYYT